MKEFKSLILIPIIFVIIIVALAFLVYNKLIKTVEEEENKYKQHLGKSVVLRKDTLLIVDYSLVKEVYILQDGRAIHYSIVNDSNLIE